MGYAVRAGGFPPLPRCCGERRVFLRERLPRSVFARQGEGPSGMLQSGCREVRGGLAENAGEVLCEPPLPLRIVEERILAVWWSMVRLARQSTWLALWVLLCIHALCSCLRAPSTPGSALRFTLFSRAPLEPK